MNLIDNWLESNLKRKEIKDCFHTALNFYGTNLETKLLEYNLELQFNDKKSHGNRKNGCFYTDEYIIEFFKVKELLNRSSLDVVFVHELAHFIDRINISKSSRYKYASSIRSSRERIVAETFRSKMKPFPKKRTNYRGRTCELFARAIEEYYAITTNNEYMLSTFIGWDYYVDIDNFKKVIMPIVKDYLCYNQK